MLVDDGGRFVVVDGGRVAVALERVMPIWVERVVDTLEAVVLWERVRGLAVDL